jgi:hypothetical protein
MTRLSRPHLALRALNDARMADPLAYLALRYTLTSKTSITNQWASSIAPEIVRRRPKLGLLWSRLYKQLGEDGEPEFRDVYRPGGPEALAEVALLDACSRAGQSFKPAKEVYSYRLANQRATEGTFIPYFQLFTARQSAIGRACAKHPGDWVIYADIKNFYPSITKARALRAWDQACEDSELSTTWRDLGRLLLTRRFALGSGLLIGPSLSHVIANLVLRKLDKEMAELFPNRYFRYVDDFAFVVPPSRKDKLLSLLGDRLKTLGLALHPGKTNYIGTKRWSENAPYQDQSYGDKTVGDERWMIFVDHIKCYLMGHPERWDAVNAEFLSNGLRIPLPRYSTEAMDSAYGERFERRKESDDFVTTIAQLTTAKLVREGLALRKHYERQFEAAWQKFASSKKGGLIRKWNLSTVRYLLGRTLLIGSLDEVERVYSIIRDEIEISEYTAMFSSLLTRNVDALLRYGWKVAASAGQVLATTDGQVTCSHSGWRQQHVEAFIALRLAGVRINPPLPTKLKTKRRIRTLFGEEFEAWSKMPYSFYRELAVLVGKKAIEAHQAILRTPADPDERWEVFADELLGVEPT